MMWSFYLSDTGVFTSQTFSGPRLHPDNIPPGCTAYDGAIDHRSKRVEIATGQLVDFTPMAEDVLVLESRALAAAMGEIEALEKLQIRSMSDLFDNPNDRAARENYDRRKAQIAELRQRVNAGRETIALAEQSRARPAHP